MHNSTLFISLNQIISGYYCFLFPFDTELKNFHSSIVFNIHFRNELQCYLRTEWKLWIAEVCRFLFEFLIKSPKGSKVRFLVQLFVDCVYQVFSHFYFLSLLPITFSLSHSFTLSISFRFTSFSLCMFQCLLIHLTPFFVKVNILEKFLDLSGKQFNSKWKQFTDGNVQYATEKVFFETKIVKTHSDRCAVFADNG